MSAITVNVRMVRKHWDLIQRDLSRQHPYAAERVGFLACGVASGDAGRLHLLADTYLPIPDDHYLRDASVGARIGGAALRLALSFAYQRPVTMLHVHRHEHDGVPFFSLVDLEEYDKFLPSFWNVRAGFPVGALLLSRDRARCRILRRGEAAIESTSIQIVGSHLMRRGDA